MISCSWAAIVKFIPNIVPHPAVVTSALLGLVPAFVALVVLLLAASWAQWRKRELDRIRLRPGEYLHDPDTLAERHRLIVSRGMMLVLVAFIAVMAVLSLLGVARRGASILATIRNWTRPAMAAAGLMAVAVVGWFRTPLATALGILADVLTYLNDYSWNSRKSQSAGPDTDRRAGQATTHGVARLQQGLRRHGTSAPASSGYWLRERIQDRLKVLVNQLIRMSARTCSPSLPIVREP